MKLVEVRKKGHECHVCAVTDLPVLGVTGEHHGIFILGDVIILLILGLLDVLLSLDALILGESAGVALLEGC
jgi:hypothetical protein